MEFLMKIFGSILLILFAGNSYAKACDCNGETGKKWTNDRYRNPSVGGCVSDGAFVDERVFIAANAKVCGSSYVSGAKIKVIGNGLIGEYAIVEGNNILIGHNSKVLGDANIGSNFKILYKTVNTGNHSNKNYNGVEDKRKADAEARRAKLARDKANQVAAEKARKERVRQQQLNQKRQAEANARKSRQQKVNRVASIQKEIVSLSFDYVEAGRDDVTIIKFPSVCMMKFEKIQYERYTTDIIEKHDIYYYDFKKIRNPEYRIERGEYNKFLNDVIMIETEGGGQTLHSSWDNIYTQNPKPYSDFKNNPRYFYVSSKRLWVTAKDKRKETGEQIYSLFKELINLCIKLK